VIFKIFPKDPFSKLDQKAVEDPRLSWKAKGILLYLVGKPADWKVRVGDIAKHSCNGEKAVYSALKEQRRAGYARLEQVRVAGRIREQRWWIFETPNTDPKLLDGPFVHQEKGDVTNTYKNPAAAPQRTAGEKLISFCAKQLDKYLHSRNKLNGKPTSLPKWEKQLGWLLRQDLGGDESRLIRVARAYVEREDKFKPSVDNAYQFREKFPQIERWVNKYEPPPAPKTVERVTVRRVVI